LLNLGLVTVTTLGLFIWGMKMCFIRLKTAKEVRIFCLQMPSVTFGGYVSKINGQYKHIILKFRKNNSGCSYKTTQGFCSSVLRVI